MRTMKKLLAILVAGLIAVVLMAGCSAPASAKATPAPTDTASEAISATPTDDTDAQDPEDEMQVAGDWQYYLQSNDPVTADTGEPPPLHRQKLDGSNDTDLGIRGDDFEIFGNYIYLDVIEQSDDETQPTFISTTRLNLDGSNAKKLEYSDMERFVPEGGQTMYFTTGGDSVIYVSDLACEEVKTIPITLPDQKELQSKLGTDYITQIDIIEMEKDATGTKDNAIQYNVTLKKSDQSADLYYGIYTTTLDGKTTTKGEGNYVDLGEQDGTAPDASSGQ